VFRLGFIGKFFENYLLIESLLWLNLFLQVFNHYFEELEEESLRDNFVVVVIDIFHSVLETVMLLNVHRLI